MTSHTNIRLLFSLGAALPFSQEPGLQPVFTWTASLACGHFLGHLFRHLAGAGHQDQARDEGAGADSQEQVVATPTPAPCQRQQRPHENTPRGRMVRNTRQRMQDKRQKHLRGSSQKLREKNASEPAEPVPYRGILSVTEDRLLSEAARTLDNICSDYLCSLERIKNGDCDDRKLSRLKTLSTSTDQTEVSQEYKVAVQSLQMLDLHNSQDDNDIQSSL